MSHKNSIGNGARGKGWVFRGWVFRGRVLAIPVLAISVLVCSAWLALPGEAQGAPANFNANEPINFSADRLEVAEEEHIATFTGNVRAVQSDFSLAADSVKVYYRSGSEGEGASAVGAGGSVSRIDINGNVRIESQGDLARGDWAIYDVDRSIVIMGGQVTLQRGDTIIRGSRLELDLNTGRTRFAAIPLPGKDQRVEGTFTRPNPDAKDTGP